MAPNDEERPPDHQRYQLAALGEILEQQILLRATVLRQQDMIAELASAVGDPAVPEGPG